MPTARRSRTLDAAPDAVWAVAGDPRQLGRWWPKVQRVEGVDRNGFTKVFGTSKGRALRADFRFTDPDGPRQARWVQIVEGTPFERILVTSQETVGVEDAGDGRAVVTVEVRQKLRGLSKMGGPIVRRATRRQLDEALDALAGLL